mmetsp:Transcript_20803/g.57290  ORF Transcript_20803/g.57290 Transcript_20803/m.57290 type:complete len:122 (+) Transcript_20803:3-368(+)
MDSELIEQIAAREKVVATLLSKPSAAVKAALADPPYGATSDSTRKRSAQVVIKAISSVPEKEVATVIEGLTEEEHDILMKYLYRGLEGTESNAQLLRWHGALTEKAGLGCIMRALQTTNRL